VHVLLKVGHSASRCLPLVQRRFLAAVVLALFVTYEIASYSVSYISTGLLCLSIAFSWCAWAHLEGFMEALVSVSEAGKRLGGISKWTIYSWLSQGKLQRTKVGGRTMVRESELAKVIVDGGKSSARPQRSK